MSVFPTRRVYKCDEGAMCPKCLGRHNCSMYREEPIQVEELYPNSNLHKGTRRLYGGEEDTLRK